MNTKELRAFYHKEICERLLRVHKNAEKGDYPNNADGDSRISVKIARGILNRLGKNPIYGHLSGQSAGKLFENITKNYIDKSFELLHHLRPGKWHYFIETEISKFEQYRDLAEVENELIATIHEMNDESQLDMLNILVEGRRLRDISDLPFDLVI